MMQVLGMPLFSKVVELGIVGTKRSENWDVESKISYINITDFAKLYTFELTEHSQIKYAAQDLSFLWQKHPKMRL